MFYLIDKPLWISSFDVIRSLRKKLNIKKMGHAGTLDPLATGCLLVATENSTKLLPLLDGSEKTYIFTVSLEWSTPSLDLWTDVTPCDTKNLTSHTSEELRDFLLSQTSQVPPRYSALHIGWQRAYDLARSGEEFEIQRRDIVVHGVQILDFSPPYFTIQMRLSSGWYVRSFAPLIGEFFGVDGWYITQLVRTQIHTHYGDISREHAVSIDDITPDSAICPEDIFPHIHAHQVDSDIYQQLREWRIIKAIPGVVGTVWDRYFLQYSNIYTSLVEFWEEGFVIMKNDI